MIGIFVLEIIAAITYYMAAVISGLKNKIATAIAIGVAVCSNGAIVIYNWSINGYVPFVSMYQVLTFLALAFFPIFLCMKYMYEGEWMFKYFCVASGVCMTGVCFMSGGASPWTFPPALQSIWFVPHILAYMIAYSLVTVACIITVVGFFKKGDYKYDNGAYHLGHTAFPFMTMGMLFGAIWANAVWGEYWSFDAKENWSLVTWLMLTLYLHFRNDKQFNNISKIFIILAFVGVIITMLFVNMMGGSSMHTYST